MSVLKHAEYIEKMELCLHMVENPVSRLEKIISIMEILKPR